MGGVGFILGMDDLRRPRKDNEHEQHAALFCIIVFTWLGYFLPLSRHPIISVYITVNLWE